MEMIFKNYVGESYELTNIIYMDMEYSCLVSPIKRSDSKKKDIYVNEFLSRADLRKLKSEHDERSVPVYVKLANAGNKDEVIKFCNQYGAIVNPFLVRGDPRHDFGPLKEILNEQEINENDYILYDHFKYYQKQMNCLLQLHSNLHHFDQKKISTHKMEQILDNIFQQCINLLSNMYFTYMIKLEYNNALDNQECEQMLASYPVMQYMYRLQTDDKANGEEDESQFQIKILEAIQNHKFPDRQYSEEFAYIAKLYYNKLVHKECSEQLKTYLTELVNKKGKVIDLANYVFQDALSFEIRDTKVSADSDGKSQNNWSFNTLANAIFHSFYFDKESSDCIAKCAYPNCGKLFVKDITSRRKYCCDACKQVLLNKTCKIHGKHGKNPYFPCIF